MLLSLLCSDVADVVTVVFLMRSVCRGFCPAPYVSPSLTSPPSVFWGLVLMMSSPFGSLQGQFAVELL